MDIAARRARLEMQVKASGSKGLLIQKDNIGYDRATDLNTLDSLGLITLVQFKAYLIAVHPDSYADFYWQRCAASTFENRQTLESIAKLKGRI